MKKTIWLLILLHGLIAETTCRSGPEWRKEYDEKFIFHFIPGHDQIDPDDQCTGRVLAAVMEYIGPLRHVTPDEEDVGWITIDSYYHSGYEEEANLLLAASRANVIKMELMNRLEVGANTFTTSLHAVENEICSESVAVSTTLIGIRYNVSENAE